MKRKILEWAAKRVIGALAGVHPGYEVDVTITLTPEPPNEIGLS